MCLAHVLLQGLVRDRPLYSVEREPSLVSSRYRVVRDEHRSRTVQVQSKMCRELAFYLSPLRRSQRSAEGISLR